MSNNAALLHQLENEFSKATDEHDKLVQLITAKPLSDMDKSDGQLLKNRLAALHTSVQNYDQSIVVFLNDIEG